MNRGRKENLYNVYLEGRLIATGITDTEVMELTGCTKNVLMLYVSRNAPYKAAEGKYTFEISEKSPDKKGKPKMDPDFEERWDKWRILALKALRSPAAIRRYRAGR